jgi:hypothetical protein
MVARTYHPNFAGNINRRITVQAGLGIKVRPYLKNTYGGRGDKGE